MQQSCIGMHLDKCQKSRDLTPLLDMGQKRSFGQAGPPFTNRKRRRQKNNSVKTILTKHFLAKAAIGFHFCRGANMNSADPHDLAFSMIVLYGKKRAFALADRYASDCSLNADLQGHSRWALASRGRATPSRGRSRRCRCRHRCCARRRRRRTSRASA